MANDKKSPYGFTIRRIPDSERQPQTQSQNERPAQKRTPQQPTTQTSAQADLLSIYWPSLDADLRTVLDQTIQWARKRRHEFFTLEHGLLALLENNAALAALRACNADIDSLKKHLGKFIKDNTPVLQRRDKREIQLTEGWVRVMQSLSEHTQGSNKNLATGADLLATLYHEPDAHAVYLLQEQNISRLDIVNYIFHGTKKSQAKSSKLKSNETRVVATGGRFHTSARVLSFVSAIAGSYLTNEAICRRSPEGAWWAEVALPSKQVAHIIWTTGGRPFARHNNQWVAVSLSGELPNTKSQLETLDLSEWQQVELSDLLANTALHPRQLVSSPELHVVAPSSLSRWILRRATSLGIQVGMVAAMRCPLHQEAPASGVLLLRLRMEKGEIPLSLVRAIANLPYTTVARPIGLSPDRLLVDVNYRPPLSEALLSTMIPEQETWLLGAPEIGHWRLLLQGSEVDGTTLLDAPVLEVLELPTGEKPKFPAPIPINVIYCGKGSGRVDAVLLDDQELAWTRLFMAGRPTGEMAFILPGLGKHLLTAPGGLPGLLPFGVPLTHLRPGGLFLEMGLDFYPALPETARKQAFQLEDGMVVAVTEEKAYRFSQENLLPAWTLWVGETQAVEAGVSEKMMEILESIDANLRAKEIQKAKASQSWFDKAKDMLKFHRSDKVQKADRGQLLEEAQRAEWSGDFLHAAEIMETLGDMAQAGRLYEKAAQKIS